MPAMSPTMTEGNIASWKVNEGDSFSTGDVLLEIETDKAQMDVEAQDDGKMAKIMVRTMPPSSDDTQPDTRLAVQQSEGSKGVKVGTRIAVLAEADDDLSTIALPADDTAPFPSPQDETQSGIDRERSSESQAEAPPSSKGQDAPFSSKPKDRAPSTSYSESSSPNASAQPSKQTYPLYPSITQLLHENSIPMSDVDKIPASGPKGRLLKGDVLAYLGTISRSYSSDQSSRISKLGHLDLSNIHITPPKEMLAPPSSLSPEATRPAVEPAPKTKVAVTVSLSSVLEVQKRIQATLGITLPLSTFIARATEVANDDLPRSSASQPTADEIFNSLLGLNNVRSKSSRGSFTPQIAALPPTPTTSRMAPRKATKKPDIIDLLTDQPPPSIATKALPKTPPGLMASSLPVASTNLLSVSVPSGDERRAKVFLERVKTILQVEPGRLVI